MPAQSARVLAVRCLRDLARTQGFSNRVLSQQLERHPEMDPRDRALCTYLVYGVLRHRARLDHHIDAHAHRPAGIKGALREVLRVAIYEMRELQRPAAIATTEALKAIAAFDPASQLRNVVQAVLSRVDREGESLDSALAGGALLDVLSQRWSIPRWLAGRWIKHLGNDAALRRAQRLAEPPPVDLRIDCTADPNVILERLEREHPTARIERVESHPWSVRVRGGGDLFYGALHGEGLVSVQGLAAQRAATMLDPQPGERVLDACAGMGVKTLQLAEMMGRTGTLVAADADEQQLSAARELRERGRLDTPSLHLQVVHADLTGHDPALDGVPFDRILLDAPCTGLGNLARHPEIRWYRRFEDVASRAQLQSALLRRCLDRLRDGGTLVYAVCSAEPEEGPGVAESVAHGTASVVLCSSATFTPEEHDTEGFYVAVLQRRP